MITRLARALACVSALAFAGGSALAQGNANPSNTVGVFGWDSVTNQPCILGAKIYSPTCQLQVTITGPDGPEGGVSVSINPYRANATSRSGSITVGGAWQQVAPANLLRQRFFMQNPCSAQTQGIATSESLFLTFSPTMPTASPLDAPGPVELVTCGGYDTSSAVVGTAPVWVWAASTGHRWSGSEW